MQTPSGDVSGDRGQRSHGSASTQSRTGLCVAPVGQISLTRDCPSPLSVYIDEGLPLFLL